VNAYRVKAGWFIPFMDKRVGGRQNCVIPLTCATPERIKGCAMQIDVYFTLLTNDNCEKCTRMVFQF